MAFRVSDDMEDLIPEPKYKIGDIVTCSITTKDDTTNLSFINSVTMVIQSIKTVIDFVFENSQPIKSFYSYELVTHLYDDCKGYWVIEPLIKLATKDDVLCVK